MFRSGQIGHGFIDSGEGSGSYLEALRAPAVIANAIALLKVSYQAIRAGGWQATKRSEKEVGITILSSRIKEPFPQPQVYPHY